MAEESKKLALLRIWQILKEHSDYDHPLKQQEIIEYLEKEYEITLERKAIKTNISLLQEAGVEIETVKDRSANKEGVYLESREFDDSELRLLIDSVLGSKHITAKYSKDLIERLCGLSNEYFKPYVSHIYTVSDWNKTENKSLFYNIELIDTAIQKKKQIHYDYNKYDINKKLTRTSEQYVSPYQLILHNQRYYLMAYSEYWKNIVYHRLEYITNMEITDKTITPIRSIKGYENGINYKELTTSMPYMYADKPGRVEFIADIAIVDQIVDWFGDNATILKIDDKKIRVNVNVSLLAMEHWALQYLNYVEVISPKKLREKIKEDIKEAGKRYK